MHGMEWMDLQKITTQIEGSIDQIPSMNGVSGLIALRYPINAWAMGCTCIQLLSLL